MSDQRVSRSLGLRVPRGPKTLNPKPCKGSYTGFRGFQVQGLESMGFRVEAFGFMRAFSLGCWSLA